MGIDDFFTKHVHRPNVKCLVPKGEDLSPPPLLGLYSFWEGPGKDRNLKLWSLSSGERLQTFDGLQGRVQALAVDWDSL